MLSMLQIFTSNKIIIFKKQEKNLIRLKKFIIECVLRSFSFKLIFYVLLLIQVITWNTIYPCPENSADLCLVLLLAKNFFRDLPFLGFGGFPCSGTSEGNSSSSGLNSPCVLLMPLSRLTAFRRVLNLLFAAALKLLILFDRDILDPLSSLLLDKLVVLLF